MIEPVAWMLGKDVTTNKQMGTVGWPAIGCGEVVPLCIIPPGYAIVPVEPTEAMLNAARDWSYGQYGKPIGNHAANCCYKAMLTAAKESKND